MIVVVLLVGDVNGAMNMRNSHIFYVVAGVLLASCRVTVVTSSRVLFLAPIASKSHMNFFGGIVKSLADHGHQITLLTAHALPIHPNVTEIKVQNSLSKVMPNNFANRHYSTISAYLTKTPLLCTEALGTDAVRNLNVEKFNLIFISVFFTDCFFSLLDEIEVPIIYVSPNTIYGTLHTALGNVDFPSFVNTVGLSGSFPLNFVGRFRNVVLHLASIGISKYWYLPLMASECQKARLCKENMRPLMEIQMKTSLIFINSVRQLELPPRPYVPAVVHAGGLNCKPAQPLPQKLEAWVQGAGKEGFIYLSLGTAVKPSEMPERSRRVLVNVFASMAQRVLWKWDEDTMEDLPDNVMLSKWLPQQDILGHPQLRLFMSHGGLFSTLEATYHGVPILGMPVTGEQQANVDRVVSEGWAQSIQWDELSEDLLRGKINDLIAQKSYKEVVQHRSVLMRDQPMSPQDTVVYWTEYVIRHKGAPHMRSPVLDMSWYEVYNVDVWFTVLVTTCVLCVGSPWAAIAIVRRCCCGRATNKNKIE